MRIETPADRAQNRQRKEQTAKRQKEQAEQAAMKDILGNTNAWDAAYYRALSRRNQVLSQQVVIPAVILEQSPAPHTNSDRVERKISRELSRFMSGMSIGAICAAIIIFAMMIAAGIV